MKVAAYARFSSDNQREESIDAQMRAIREYCDKNGYTVVKEYVDMAMSATTDNRPQFQQMVRDSGLKGFSAVVVHKLDRFARNRYDSAIYSKKLEDNGVILISVLERLDDSPESIILKSVIEGYNEYYSKNLARESKKGLKENALKGIHNGGTPPLGYDVTDGKYVINEAEAETVRKIFNSYAEGFTYSEIINQLNRMGIKTKRGSTFGKNSIYEMFSNEKYIGRYVYGKVQGRKNLRNASPADMIVIENAVPRIIDQDVWDKIQAVRAVNKSVRGGQKKARNDYLLSGLAICGECGQALTGETFKNRYGYYRCSGRHRKQEKCSFSTIRQDKLENFIFESVKKNLIEPISDPKLFSEMRDLINKDLATLSSEYEEIEKALKVKEKEINNVVEAISKGLYSEALARKLQELEKNKLSLEYQFKEAKFKEQATICSRSDLLNLKTLFDREKTAEETKTFLKAIIRKILVWDNRAQIIYQLPVSESMDSVPLTSPAPT